MHIQWFELVKLFESWTLIIVPLELAGNSLLSFGFQVQLFLCLWSPTHIALKSEHATEINQWLKSKKNKFFYDSLWQGNTINVHALTLL